MIWDRQTFFLSLFEGWGGYIDLFLLVCSLVYVDTFCLYIILTLRIIHIVNSLLLLVLILCLLLSILVGVLESYMISIIVGVLVIYD